ncbi:MAG: class I SAM-dependent methyltransferase [Rhodospirillales bacterium]|nr:class I SAM-dependent methyltransferase [Rhodospirillales bacterium]
MNQLTELADRHGSDKGMRAGNGPHRYSLLYDLIFHDLRTRPIVLGEIGLAVGGPDGGGPVERRTASPSVAMWLGYFPQARIFGFDISDFAHLESDRFRFVRGDCGTEEDLRRFATAAGAFDVLIDDGSHASYHQQLALRVLLPAMRPGGVYIIEDLHWQSPVYEGTLPQVPRTRDFLYSFLMDGIYIENRLFSRSDMEAIRNRLVSFATFPDFSMRGEGDRKLAVLRVATEE